MLSNLVLLAGFAVQAFAIPSDCPDYSDYSQQRHAPFSPGKYKLSSMRPAPACRTFNLTEVEKTIVNYKKTIKDPDLYRLFQNSFPNTLDTAIKWKGVAANNSEEELTFIITGDINAMWLRDSANQLQSYKTLLKASDSRQSLASLYRGAINLHTRYLLTSPYCQSFQPPTESDIPPAVNGAGNDDTVTPPYSNHSVFECKYELDSLAAFLELSTNYYEATNDIDFFGKFQWIPAVQAVLNVAQAMRTPTYAADGQVEVSNYTFTRLATSATDTLSNNGLGNPVFGNTGLIRSAFRPSDDATIYQLFIPANMMFSRYLKTASRIMRRLPGSLASSLAQEMRTMSADLRVAIAAHGIFHDQTYGPTYAYEVDGYDGVNTMDDANIPSLLAAPFFGYCDVNSSVYQNTRRKILSVDNPYFMRGPVINAVGGPHDGPGQAWPMASIVRIFTSDNETEVYTTLREIVSSTDGLGLIHESVNSFNQSKWTREWFSWANGLFGQMILDLDTRMPSVLGKSYQ